MALINKAKREINAKIVYYGCPGVGKQLSLRYIYDRLKPALRGEFKNMASMGDSLQFFDFTPFESKMFGDYRLCFHVYTLTGEVNNPANWKMTLKGADGIVFVTNNSPETLHNSKSSLATLRDFFSSYGRSLNEVPLVQQICKSPAHENLNSDYISKELALPGVTAFTAEPTSGFGILETLSELSQMILKKIGQEIIEPVKQEHTSQASITISAEAEPEPVTASETEQEHEQEISTVTIPLQLTVAGKKRRFKVTVSLYEEEC